MFQEICVRCLHNNETDCLLLRLFNSCFPTAPVCRVFPESAPRSKVHSKKQTTVPYMACSDVTSLRVSDLCLYRLQYCGAHDAGKIYSCICVSIFLSVCLSLRVFRPAAQLEILLAEPWLPLYLRTTYIWCVFIWGGSDIWLFKLILITNKRSPANFSIPYCP